MSDSDAKAPSSLDILIDTLQDFLETSVSISTPQLMTFGKETRVHPTEQEGVEITIDVRNEAPPTKGAGEVVFVGVGLRITDGREGQENGPHWARLEKNHPSEQQSIRERYSRGMWTSRERFPAVTSAEDSFGDVLFPGERVIYSLRAPTAYLPYTDIQVENSVSRRHLFHFVHRMRELDPWTKPLMAEIFKALRDLNLWEVLREVVTLLPEFTPKTTMSEIAALREKLTETIDHIGEKQRVLNDLYHKAPNHDMREHFKYIIGENLGLGRKACLDAVEAMSSQNTQKMNEAMKVLKQLNGSSQDADRKTSELMSRFEINL